MMTSKQAKSILIGSVLVIGGVVFFGVNRRKKLLYQSITDTIDDRGGTYQSGNPYQGSSTGCSLPSSQVTTIAKNIHEAISGVGTDEELLKSSYELIPTRRCLVRVADSYVSQGYGTNMNSDIRNDLNGFFDDDDDLKDYEDFISRLPQ
tara:strand:- start:690 stop:1136 length:447 start_codon:yes stop_codon:yes gene_type:complete